MCLHSRRSLQHAMRALFLRSGHATLECRAAPRTLVYIFKEGSTSAQGPNQLGPIQKRTQGEFWQFLFRFSSVLPMKQLASRRLPLPNTCDSCIRMISSPKVLDLDDCFSGENPTVIMVTLLCGRVLSERALQLLRKATPPVNFENITWETDLLTTTGAGASGRSTGKNQYW